MNATLSLSDRELATVLASLRAFQCMLPLKGMNSEWFLAVSTDGGTLTPMSAGEVEDLIQRLNCGPEPAPEPPARANPEEGDDLTRLTAEQLSLRVVRLIDMEIPPAGAAYSLGVEVLRRLRLLDAHREESRRLIAGSFAFDAANQIWLACGGRPLVASEARRFETLLSAFFKTVR